MGQQLQETLLARIAAAAEAESGTGRSATFASVADATVGTSAASILAADTTRREAIIVADETNSTWVRVGDGSVSATQGAKLLPGASITVSTTAAISAIAGAASQKVSMSTVKD